MRLKLRQALYASTIIVFSGFGIGGAFAAGNDATPMTASGMPDHRPANAPAVSAGTKTMMQRVEKRITELHAALRVTAAQQPHWDQFVKVMRANAENLDEVVITDADGMTRMTATEQMRAYAKITEQHAKDVRSLIPAFDSLYDAMSPEQKLNADNYFRADARRARHGGKA